MRLEAPAGDHPRDILAALKSALHGAGPALALGAPAGRLPAEVPAGTAVVVTTSGSTGVPKSVVLSRSALTASAMSTAERIGSGAWLLALPATYVAGLQVLVRATVAGREPAVLSGRFTPQAFAAAALTMASARGGERVPTFTSLVPAQLQTILDAADDDTVLRAARSFEAVLIGGQALPAAVRERAEAAGMRIVRTYGSTETSGGCVYDGVPLDGTGMRVVEGELQLSGPTLADGYLGDPDRTAAAFPLDADGIRWYRTGDEAVIDDGALRVQGRIDNVIVSGGINVSLDRVERVVRGIAGLHGAVVIGVADERWGEASVIVSDSPDAHDRAEELLRIARDAVGAGIGPHARPSRLVPVEALPLLSSGKPDRERLRRDFA